MIKYYQVFISSTSKNLKTSRQKIITDLLSQNKFFPIAMEHMVSESNTLEMLYNYMKSSDVCVLLLGDDVGTALGNAIEYVSNPDMLDAIEKYNTKNGMEDARYMTYTEFEFALALHFNVAVLAFVKDTVVTSCESGHADKTLHRFYNAVREKAAYSTWTDEPSPTEIVTSLNRHIDTHPDLSGWIKEKDSAIYKSASYAGITDISLEGFLPREKLKVWLADSQQLKICYTTGRSFILSNGDILSDFVANGGSIKFLCCKPHTQSLNDIQAIEETVFGDRTQIHHELFDVCSELRNIYNISKKKFEANSCEKIGEIQINFLSTLFRSSFLIAENSSQNQKFGWFTITLPPAKSRETISFEMISNEDSSSENNLLNRSLIHFESVWKYSLETENIIDIATFDKYVLPNAEDSDSALYWREKEKIATSNIKKRKRNSGILIEVAAQHPLEDGIYPNAEFAARLDRAAALYFEKTNEGNVVRIYTPGSIHLDFDGVADEISLSEAGRRYLIEKGIPAYHIYDEDKNHIYDNERFHKGVYNTADECFVASKLFFDEHENFGQLYSICSPNQLMRKMLFYIEFGVLPNIITVPLSNMFHNFFNELFTSVPYIINEDHNYQSESSKEAIRTRKERFPEYSDH